MKTQRKKKSLRKTRKCKKGGKSAVAVLDMGRVKGVVRFVKQKGGVKVKYEIKGLKDGMHDKNLAYYIAKRRMQVNLLGNRIKTIYRNSQQPCKND
mgnify:CR=1 FL=1